MGYTFNENSREISGFGGGYEDACRKMVIAGMEWFDNNPNANPVFAQYENVTGICMDENEDAKSISRHITSVADGCSGAMHQAAINHIMYAHKNGWAKYMKEMCKAEQD